LRAKYSKKIGPDSVFWTKYIKILVGFNNNAQIWGRTQQKQIKCAEKGPKINDFFA